MYKIRVYWCRLSMDTEHLPVYFVYRIKRKSKEGIKLIKEELIYMSLDIEEVKNFLKN